MTTKLKCSVASARVNIKGWQVPRSCLHCLETVLTALISSQSLTVAAQVAGAVNPAVKPTETVHATKMVQGVAAVNVHGRMTATSSLPVTLIEPVSAAVTLTQAWTKAANAILLAAALPLPYGL